MAPESDEDLMRRFQDGDRRAFEELAHRYASHLLNFAYRSFFDRSEAEDVAQDVLVRVYAQKDSYDPDRPFRSWLFSIAAHRISNRLRHFKRHPEVPVESADNKGTEPLLEKVIRNEEDQWIQKALDQLPERQRTAILLLRLDLSYAEIADSMGLSNQAVKSLIFRGRTLLARLLKP